jgi:hypothetical protein
MREKITISYFSDMGLASNLTAQVELQYEPAVCHPTKVSRRDIWSTTSPRERPPHTPYPRVNLELLDHRSDLVCVSNPLYKPV